MPRKAHEGARRSRFIKSREHSGTNPVFLSRKRMNTEEHGSDGGLGAESDTHHRDRAIAPSCHNPKQLGTKFVDRRSQHALGLDACLAGRVEPQQVHHDVANDGQVVGGIAAAHP